MPYNNQYNHAVAGAAKGFSQPCIDREHAISDFTTNYDIPSQLESAVMRHPKVHGGIGFGAATVQDLGFEPTLGATSGEGVPRRARKKVIEVGEGLSAAGVSAAGMTAAAKPKKATRKSLQVPLQDAPILDATAPAVAEGVSGGKRPRKKKGEGVSGGALLSLKDLDAMKRPPPDSIKATIAPTSRPQAAVGSSAMREGMVGGLQRRSIEIVKEVMKKHKLSLPAASKYVKEHKLY